MGERDQDCIQDMVEVLANVLRQKSQDKETVLLRVLRPFGEQQWEAEREPAC